MELYARVRRAVFVEGVSEREAAQRFGLARETVRKMLRYAAPPGYRRQKPIRRPKLDAYTPIIDQILETDLALPKKQRHTAKRIFERLRDEHDFAGGYTIIKDYVRLKRTSQREMFVPLTHPPGHAQAFRYWGGVPRRILYDNTTLAVARILGDGTRQKTQAFSELQSHYLFAERFGRPGKGNDKGKVENLVKVARRSFFVPRPRFPSWEALNVWLEEQCRKRRERRQRGHREKIGERFERDRQALLALPAAAYEACETRPGRVTSLSLVRYHTNDYSVPTKYGHRQVLIKGYVDKVVICAGSEEIARHRRSYGREGLIFHPLHYLALLERKTGALEQAAPLEGWQLPEEFAGLRRLLEARLGKAGAREYVQVLRLLEDVPLEEVRAAVGDALRLGAISFDAVKHLVLCRIEQRPPRLELENYPHLPTARVATTAAADYLALVDAGAE